MSLNYELYKFLGNLSSNCRRRKSDHFINCFLRKKEAACLRCLSTHWVGGQDGFAEGSGQAVLVDHINKVVG